MILLNQLRGMSARVTMPKAGAWFADVDVDPDIPVLPIGPAILAIGTTTVLKGTIDDRHTGRFGAKATIRLVGGLGWDKPVPPLHIHNDAGVFSPAIYAVTAATVGEPPVVELGPPKLFGVDYVRTQGPAARVFAGVEWWVDILGITHTGPRLPLPAPPPPVIDILEWDPKAKVAVIASDILIQPGMTLVDPVRFGTAIVDDVEHTFKDGGGRAIAWCSTPSLAGAAAAALASPPPAAGSKLVRALGALARESAGVSALKKYAYRVVIQAPDGRVNLQLSKLVGAAPPFLTLIDIWAGLPGMSCKLSPTSSVLVSFIEGDPGRPIIVGFDPKNPPAVELKLDALRIALGTLAISPVAKAPGTQAQITAIVGAIAAIATYIAALSAAFIANPASYAPTALAMGPPGAAVAGALGGLAAAITALVAPATSTKTFTD